jgi:hypothetical protein
MAERASVDCTAGRRIYDVEKAKYGGGKAPILSI